VKPKHPFGTVAVCWLVFFVLVPSMCAQEATAPRHTGVPQDWSQHHIVFSRDALAQHPDVIYREPRVLHQAMQRWQGPNSDVFRGADPLRASAGKLSQTRDWNVSLGKGRISINMFPAKFSFDPGAPPDCTNDYVLFGLATVGATGGTANLVAFNNLYAGNIPPGLCGAAPTVLFAYNITTSGTGKIITSPILSEDGKKVAFVESNATFAVFHVLTWTAGQGTIAAAAAPTMTSLTFSPLANSTTSSPWIDYFNDIVYLGNDKGSVYKITGVFKGTPTLAGAPWPVSVGSNFHLTPPVLDVVRGKLMVGSANGTLYQIDTTSGVVSTLGVGKAGQTSPGILAAPIVDVTNGTTFVVSANDGTSAVLVQVDTATMLRLSKARIGLGSTSGTPINLYQPAFSNDYFNSPSSGEIHLCGTGAADTTPWQYAFGFTGNIMNKTPSSSQQLLTSTVARCSAWTEFFNPNVGPADTITATSVTSNVLTVTASNTFTVGETVYIQGTAESFLNGQAVIVASLIGPGPTHAGFTASFTASNYANASDTGTVSAGTDFFFFGLNQDCTATGFVGGCVVARSSDSTLVTVAVDGGPTGIVIDNYSTAGQAASIYFSAARLNIAYKFTQNGLH
jgi:hypothetical protein